jgi:MSHA biogenesis protein MshG
VTLYSYKGRSQAGKLVSGRLEGDTADVVASRLLSGGITPIDVTALLAERPEALGDLGRRLGLGKPKLSDLVLFSRQMYTITKSGIPLLRGVRGLAASTHNAVMREALQDILGSLESGRDLAASFARHPKLFPTLYINLVRVGESTGTLESSFQRLGEYLAKDADMHERVKSAMRYPMIVTIVIAIAMVIVTTFVIPHFAPLFRSLGSNIPLPTRIIIAASNFVLHQWYVVLCALAVVSATWRHYVRTEKGRYQWDRLKLRLPGVGRLAHEAILARVSRSLSISLTAGMPMIQTLKLIAQSSGNEYMSERVLRMSAIVERGDSLSRAAATTGMFPPLVLQMMEVGEETGELPDLMEEIAGYYDREVDYALKTLSAAIEPVLIVAVGGMVLVLALGVFLPMWNMIGSAGGGGG